MTIRPRDVLPGEAFTLPQRYYLDSVLFERELAGVFGRLWLCAGRAEDVSPDGRFVVREVAGRNIVVTSVNGAVRAFHNVCRHRGTRLCSEPAGTFAGRIQCPYHAWTYDLDGRLVGAPHMQDVPHFRPADYPLHGVAAATWDGHVFLNLSSDPVPLADQLGPLPDRFSAWRMASLRRARRITYDVRANWKLVVQNYNECLHCPNVHPALNRLSHYLTGENDRFRPSLDTDLTDNRAAFMGGRMDLRDGIATMTMTGRSARARLPGLSDEESRGIYYYAVFPNLLLSLHPDYVMSHTLWPVAPDRTRIDCEWHFDPEEMARPGFDPTDAVEFWDLTNRQDWEVCELSQAGISSPAYTPGPYSNREDLLYAFDCLIRDLHGEA